MGVDVKALLIRYSLMYNMSWHRLLSFRICCTYFIICLIYCRSSSLQDCVLSAFHLSELNFQYKQIQYNVRMLLCKGKHASYSDNMHGLYKHVLIVHSIIDRHIFFYLLFLKKLFQSLLSHKKLGLQHFKNRHRLLQKQTKKQQLELEKKYKKTGKNKLKPIQTNT